MVKWLRVAWVFIGVVAFSALAGDDRELLSVQGLLDQDRGQVSMARIDGYLKRHPGDPRGQFLQARAYERAGKLAQAIEVYQQLVQDHPELPEPFINLAVLYADAGQYEQARKLLVQALSNHPVYGRVYQNLINLHATLASRAYKSALSLNGEIAKPKLRAADTLVSLSPAALSAAMAQASAPELQSSRSSSTRPTPRPPESVQVVRAQTPPANPVPVKMSAKASGAASKQSPAPVKAETVTTPPPVPKPKPVQVRKVEPPVAQPAQGKAVRLAKAKPGHLEEPRQQSKYLVTLVKHWAEAWSTQDVKRYLAFYSENFQPNTGLSRRRWEQQRTLRIANKQRIQVKVTDIRTSVNGKTATVSFRQSYHSETFGDTVRKTLTLEHGPDGWKIIREAIHG